MGGSHSDVIQGSELIQEMERYAPSYLAIDKDPIGLQVGDPNAMVNGVLVCLEVTKEVVREAVSKGANWIIAHHPVIFRPLKALRLDQPEGRFFSELLTHKINVYVAHTNLDVTKQGVNDVLASRIGLTNTTVFVPITQEKIKKLVVFVPKSHHTSILEAITKAGGGRIGNYSACSFNIEGTGTFCPEEGTNPYIGKQGTLEKVQEIRLETVVKDSNQLQVIQAMLESHPYEEVAYDIYPLEINGETFGLGRVGELTKEVSLQEFAESVKDAYGIKGIRVTGDPHKMIKKVAVLGGSGSKFMMDAVKYGADVYITGDVDYHTAQDALAHGMAILDPGHHVEHLVVDKVCTILQERLHGLNIKPSEIDTNPFRFI